MPGYTKLFSEIITSSIWSEDDKTRLVWVTLLALKDKDGFVAAAIPGLANAARVSIEECEMAINKLESPDKYSRTTDFEGRRIKKGDGGWHILNHKKFRDKLSTDKKTVQARERMKNMRERNSSVTLRNTVSVYESASSNNSLLASQAGQAKPASQAGQAGGQGWTLAECLDAAAQVGLAEDEVKAFHAYYAAQGWVYASKAGLIPMADLQFCLLRWKNNPRREGTKERFVSSQEILEKAGIKIL